MDLSEFFDGFEEEFVRLRDNISIIDVFFNNSYNLDSWFIKLVYRIVSLLVEIEKIA